jgi:hypothetical protein
VTLRHHRLRNLSSDVSTDTRERRRRRRLRRLQMSSSSLDLSGIEPGLLSLGMTDNGCARHRGGGRLAATGRLCVFADPLYRRRRGTPPAAIAECQLLLRIHNLGPPSVCDTQYFVLGDVTDNPRQAHVRSLAFLSFGAILAVVGFTTARRDLARRMRRLGSPFDQCFAYAHKLDDILL